MVYLKRRQDYRIVIVLPIPRCNQNTQILAMHQKTFYHKSAANVKQTVLHCVAHAESTDLFVPLPVVKMPWHEL